MTRSSSRPTYAEIDLAAFSKNIDKAREISNTDIIAVVKADAYGHGAYRMADYAYRKKNVRFFAVATFEEAAEVRSAVPFGAEILVMGYVAPEYIKDAIEMNITLSAFSEESLRELSYMAESIGKKVKTAVKIDTGMSRLGFIDFPNIVDISRKYVYIDIVHTFSHLASVFSDNAFANEQIAAFNSFLSENDCSVTSSIMSTSGIQYAACKCTYARPGIMLYGYGAVDNPTDIMPVMTVKSSVVHVRHLKKGESVGYGRTFFAERDMFAGVVPIGYADGYLRDFSSKAHMLMRGIECRVLGTVCMDMTMIDVSAFGESALGGEVEVLGRGVRADSLAELAGTISYEILCGVSKRVPRTYINGE